MSKIMVPRILSGRELELWTRTMGHEVSVNLPNSIAATETVLNGKISNIEDILNVFSQNISAVITTLQNQVNDIEKDISCRYSSKG